MSYYNSWKIACIAKNCLLTFSVNIVYLIKKYSNYPNNEINISSMAQHVQQYMNYVAPQHCRGFYQNRANGKSIIKCGLLD